MVILFYNSVTVTLLC